MSSTIMSVDEERGQKRPRSTSSPSEDDESFDQQTPGARYGKDSLVCDQCGVVFRKHSDLKKHNARHSRVYRCVEEGCPRSSIGFATINDLYRHEKSVHGKHVGKSRMYKCFAPGCAKASKLWPRLDNFKQHLIRMHPTEDIDALVKRSEQWHAEEEDQGGSQGEQRTPDSVINSLQNVKRLRSPPRMNGPPGIDNAPPGPRRWDLTPPTGSNQHRAQELRQVMTDPSRQTNGDRMLDGNREILPRPPPPDLRHTTTEPPKAPAPDNEHKPDQLMPDETKEISRPVQFLELSTEARCNPCYLSGRRCYVDQNNPRHCVSCPSSMHCVFRRVVVREGPAHTFTPAELVGSNNLLQQGYQAPQHPDH